MTESADSAVAELAGAAREQGRLALDTEFVGEGRYWPLLCLVAVAVDGAGGPRTEALDPLAPLDPSPLAEVLADRDVEVVVHAGRQDIALLRRTWNTEVTNVFDTQVAAGFAGLSAQMGYSRLVRSLLRVDLKDGEGFSRWDQRPLNERQLRYAREDAEHLLALADRLQHDLSETGRLDWARDECRPLEAASDERIPEEAFRRLPRVNRMSARDLAVARELAAWRERTAAEEDRPVNAVVGDAQLAELAKRRPADRGDLQEVRGLYPRTIQRRGDELLAVVARGIEAEPVSLDGRPPPSDPDDHPLVSLAEAMVRVRAREAGLAYELIASRADLQAVVRCARAGEPEPDIRTIQGWRRELVGADVLEMLAGRRTLSVGDDRRLRIDEP